MQDLRKIRIGTNLNYFVSLRTNEDFVINSWQELQLKGRIEVISPTNRGKRDFPLLIFRETGEVAYRYVCNEQYPHPKGWNKSVREII